MSSNSSEAAKNAKLLREFQLIPKLLLTLRDQTLSQPTVAAISNVLSLLLQGFPNSYDLLRYTLHLHSIKHRSPLAIQKSNFEGLTLLLLDYAKKLFKIVEPYSSSSLALLVQSILFPVGTIKLKSVTVYKDH